eukprot:TRINITY_DN27247_c0_g1_i1.p3 TRINITY_DN27247_c0_g1~~TRINITY_DN27247_c0_g1_i1.p3  ORF type:complete len:169 (+),score=29.70 TRINITY_DN27247_c0_g1_i1:67-573(+)
MPPTAWELGAAGDSVSHGVHLTARRSITPRVAAPSGRPGRYRWYAAVSIGSAACLLVYCALRGPAETRPESALAAAAAELRDKVGVAGIRSRSDSVAFEDFWRRVSALRPSSRNLDSTEPSAAPASSAAKEQDAALDALLARVDEQVARARAAAHAMLNGYPIPAGDG